MPLSGFAPLTWSFSTVQWDTTPLAWLLGRTRPGMSGLVRSSPWAGVAHPASPWASASSASTPPVARTWRRRRQGAARQAVGAAPAACAQPEAVSCAACDAPKQGSFVDLAPCRRCCASLRHSCTRCQSMCRGSWPPCPSHSLVRTRPPTQRNGPRGQEAHPCVIGRKQGVLI